ncbi:MAG: hypothetical protein JW969_15140 [Spirochaetales bacterium]|nr:hypothetical protein [Spirochaetales bacterium]
MKKCLIIGFLLFLLFPLGADELEDSLGKLAGKWVGFFAIIGDLDKAELTERAGSWVDFFDAIKDLDLDTIDDEDEEKAESLQDYLFIIADTKEIAEQLAGMIFADADISGNIEALNANIKRIMESEDLNEEESFLLMKKTAHSVWYLCDRWDIPVHIEE